MPKVSIIIPVYNTEKYIGELLESVKNQTFTDFEAIVVNDGSTDGSQAIIEDYCAKDDRFTLFMQENRGVSAARNAGLDKARGAYVTFYDSDDTVPPHALESMYQTAEEHNSDLVVGGRSDVFFSIRKANKRAMRFAENEVINKFDSNFVYSFGLWNKLFRRTIITENNIRFGEGDYVEDGLFVFAFLEACETINGCNSDVYEYKKRVAFDGNPSLSQGGKKHILELIIRDFDIIHDRYINLVDESETAEKENLKHAFEQDLMYREINVQLLNQFYRRLWTIDSSAVDLAVEKFNELVTKLDPEAYETLKDAHLDINIDRPLKSREEIAENPTTAVIVTGGVSDANIDRVIASIYNQLSPTFAVYVSAGKEQAISEGYRDIENFHFIDAGDPQEMLDKVMSCSGAEFIIIINEDIILNGSSLLVLVKFLIRHGEFDMVMAPVHKIDMEHMTSQEIGCIGQLYDKSLSKKEKQKYQLEWFDCLYGNKVIRRKALENPETLKAYKEMDCDYLISKLKTKRKTTTEVFVCAEECDIISLCKSRKAVKWYKKNRKK